jgi:hypothetical protein
MHRGGTHRFKLGLRPHTTLFAFPLSLSSPALICETRMSYTIAARLPRVVVQCICHGLSARDIANVARTCREWRAATREAVAWCTNIGRCLVPVQDREAGLPIPLPEWLTGQWRLSNWNVAWKWRSFPRVGLPAPCVLDVEESQILPLCHSSLVHHLPIHALVLHLGANTTYNTIHADRSLQHVTHLALRGFKRRSSVWRPLALLSQVAIIEVDLAMWSRGWIKPRSSLARLFVFARAWPTDEQLYDLLYRTHANTRVFWMLPRADRRSYSLLTRDEKERFSWIARSSADRVRIIHDQYVPGAWGELPIARP